MIIKHPVSNEKSIRMMDTENKLVFAVDIKATRTQVKDEIQDLYKVKVASVNTRIGPDGVKFAYVRFTPETPAIDIATDLGLI